MKMGLFRATIFLMKALYRKYRPLHLSEVIGQDKTIEQLQGALTKGKISHAYLFVGPRGCGKTSVARIFAHEINHFDYQLEDSYIDIIEIDAATFTSVDNIRELREKAMIMPTLGKYKVYIIDEVHMLSNSAFNALLKILEEPPEHVIFIMATTNPEKIPATIISRTQIYRFNLAEPKVMQDFLRSVCDKEGIKISDDALKIITERGGGSFRDSLSILNQIGTVNLSEKTIEASDVSAALGIPEHQEIQNLINFYENSDTENITNTLAALLNYGITAESITLELINQILKNPTPKSLQLVNQLFNVTGSFLEAKLTVALISNSFVTPAAVTSTASIAPVSSPQPTTPTSTAAPITSTTTPAPYSATTNSQASVKPTSTPGAKPSPFAELREQLAKNAKNHKAERALPPKEPEEMIQEAPPTLPEAVVSSSGDFNFNGFVANVTNVNPTLMTALKKSFFVIVGKNFDIYPEKAVYWRILGQKNNLEILRGATNSIELTVRNPDVEVIPKTAVSFEQAAAGQTKKAVTVSPKIESLSAIMGDVQEVNENPF
ncbi:DNA polymerase III subunit gamma/tau [Candidatus Saccharibacteria bacterium]|nr:DNA polymerase III subunit gamma/tau [Candidatus Saccharibacteria bacterium]